MKYYRIPLVALSLIAAPVFASDLDLSLTNDSVRGQVNFFEASDDLQLGGGYTYREGRRHIFNVDFHAQGRTALGNLPTTAGIGMRAIGWEQRKLDGGALALGGYATVNIPAVPGFSVYGSAHYAPRILSFGDTDDLLSLELRAAYRVIRNADIFAGVRYLKSENDGPGRVHLDKGPLVGLKIYF